MSDFRRRLIMNAIVGEPALPYDAEVDYIGSNGSGAYIDSGIECTGDLSFDCEVYWSADTNAAICGGIKQISGSTYFRHHMTPQNSSSHPLYWYQQDNRSLPSICLRGGPSPGGWRHISLDTQTGDWVYVDQSGSVTPLSGSLTTGKNYGILARIGWNGSIQQKASRVRWFKLSRGGVLLRDFIPVRVGTVGFLYDKVSGQLFGNAGSGSLEVGNDK